MFLLLTGHLRAIHLGFEIHKRMCAGGLREQSWQEQLAGLQASLLASKADWKIVIGHHPPRSNGHHNNTDELIQHLEPVLQVTRAW